MVQFVYHDMKKKKMNERIKQLAEQAGISLSQKDYSYYWVESAEDIEKFAELIVAECAKVCDDLDIDDWGDKSFDDGTYYCSRAIKTHFGVEDGKEETSKTI